MSYSIRDYEDIKKKISELKKKKEIIEKDLIKQGILDENQLKAIKFLKRKAKMSVISKEYMNTLIKDVQGAESRLKDREKKEGYNEKIAIQSQTREIKKNINLLNSSNIKDEDKIKKITKLIDDNVTSLKQKSKEL